MELVKISELDIKEITTVDAYLPIIDNVGDDIENYRISLLNLFKTGGIINVNRTYGDNNYTLQTALGVIEPTLLVNGVFITFKGMDGWELYQKELDTYVKYLNKIDDELEVGSNNPLSNDAITRMYNELLSTINNLASMPHNQLTDKNGEPNFQHVTQEEKTGFHTHTNKEYLDNYNPTLFATALQGEKADSALQSLPPNTVIDADYPALKNKVNGIEENANNYEHPLFHSTKILSEVSSIAGDIYKYLNQRGNFTKPIISHIDLTYKNDETAYQHVTQEEKDLINVHTEDISNLETNKADKSTTLSGYGITDAYTKDEIDTNFENHKTYSNVTREELLTLINNNALIPNSSYRITDYTTTTAQDYTTSAGHDFDIIVTALSSNKLSEVASCVRKADDTYFANAKLEAWDIKYCIINDTSRFAWADAVNGKGVIYYMKDEWGNECPYDFKNIQFNKLSVFLYTFGGATDDSLTGGCHNNIMMSYILNSVLKLNSNTFGTNSYGNTFGTGCYSNTFGNNCQNNKFGIYCQINTFDNGCVSNTFGDNCNNNTFGNNCYYNTFGDSCKSNNFYNGTSGATKKDYLRYIVLEDGCSYNNFYSELTTNNSSYLQRIRIKGLEHTTATNTPINLSETNTKYEWLIYYTSSGVLKQHFIGYGLVNTETIKETLVEDDKLTIYDSETGKIVLTDKSNVGVEIDDATTSTEKVWSSQKTSTVVDTKQNTLVSGTNIKTINNESILGGGNINTSDIISTNVTNNTGTIVIDTTPNWQRVNISGGGSTLILDYANGTLPTKNREYLLVINNASDSTITLTLPTVSFVKGGITYNFTNTEVSVTIEAGKSIEVNVVFFFIDSTTCNIRTQITQFI